ncbi:YcdB/YcdC domain-containing protein [Brevibacillus sp. B_LB10_24]|uniref:YcdB/YcdC domain-containing protein n=1 Tax=Brevibacillus sp. B_LB10_24 TaxID=3380645 RepID=UPI0038BC763F
MNQIKFSKSKAVLQCAIAASLVLGAVPSAGAAAAGSQTSKLLSQADAKVTREEAIAIAEKVVTPPSGFEGPEATFQRSWRGFNENPSWEVSWRSNGGSFQSMSVLIDTMTGELLEINRWNLSNENASAFPPKVTYEEAVKIAQDQVGKLFGSKAAFQYEDDGDEWGKVVRGPEDSYRVSFRRLVNGVPVMSQGLQIQINGNGELVYLYNHSGQNIQYQDPSGVIPQNDFHQKADEQMKMKLAYITIRPNNPSFAPAPGEKQKEEIRLGYLPAISNNLFDAKTGEAVDFLGRTVTLAEPSDQPLGEKQAGTPARRNAPVTEKEVLDILKRDYSIPQEVDVSDIKKSEGWWNTDKPVWQVQMEYGTANSSVGWTGAVIEAETGKVLEFRVSTYLYDKYRSDMKEGKEPPKFPVSEEKAKEIALAFAKKQSADKLDQLFWSSEPRESRSADEPVYSFRFERRVNGVPAADQYVQVGVSAEDGSIVEYGLLWNETAAFPEVDGTIDALQAKETYLKEAEYQLRYILTSDPYQMPSGSQPLEAKLVYQMQLPWTGLAYIDAKTGQMKDWTGADAKPKQTESDSQPSDIKGHDAENELSYMVKLKVIKPQDGLVLPDQVVSRGEFLNMFLTAAGTYGDPTLYRGSFDDAKPSFGDVDKDSPYFGAVELAVRDNLLDSAEKTFEPERPITREEAAKLLVTALGYQKLAERDKLYQLPFADRDEIRYKGFVAIAGDIGLITGEGQRYNPKAKLTRAETAVILYRYLQKRAEYRVSTRF